MSAMKIIPFIFGVIVGGGGILAASPDSSWFFDFFKKLVDEDAKISSTLPEEGAQPDAKPGSNKVATPPKESPAAKPPAEAPAQKPVEKLKGIAADTLKNALPVETKTETVKEGAAGAPEAVKTETKKVLDKASDAFRKAGGGR